MNKKHNKEDILRVGIDLMRTTGYHNVGVQEVIKTCSIPKGSFYNFFESKEKFAVQAIQLYSSDILEFWTQIEQSQELNGEQKVHAAFKVLFNEYQEGNYQRTCLLGNLSLETCSSSKALGRQIEQSWTEWKEVLRLMIQQAREEGSFSNRMSSSAITNFLFDTFYGILNRIKVERSSLPVKQFFSVYIPMVQA